MRRLEKLAALRDRFLHPKPGEAPYWTDSDLLEAYDESFAQRIGWKWDAVCRELKLRGWQPDLKCNGILDWGCGTGIATRRILLQFPALQQLPIRVHDHSMAAVAAAQEYLKDEYPESRVAGIVNEAAVPAAAAGSILVISHVVNELQAADYERLLQACATAAAVLWVEAGRYEESHALIRVRESLRGTHHIIAPCTHGEPCPMSSEDHACHWCHHFATPPVEAFTDGDWARFGLLMNIDLRSLPYSFMVMDQRPGTGIPDSSPDRPIRTCQSRVIGHPREYKGYMKVLSCEASGLHEYRLQKRSDKELFKRLRKERHFGLYTWDTKGGEIMSATGLDTEGLR